MYKWIMVVLFAGAALFGLGVLAMDGMQQAEDYQEESPSPDVPVDLAAAEAIFKQSCVSCHGAELQGGIGPELQKVGARYNREQVAKIIQTGRGGMPGFKGSLSDEEINNLAGWLAEKN
jgi:mono/diheme cytochrome c family protein